MSSSTTKSEKMNLAPVRSLNDFLLDTKKYSQPSFNDLKRFNNRVISNLLYYQTNYFAVSAAIFMLTLFCSFNRLFAGVFGITTSVATALFATDRLPYSATKELRAKYPFATYGALAVNLFVLFFTFRPILFFALVVLVPVLFWILHASMRNRGIKNKVNNKMEQLGASVYGNTPMTFVLGLMGIDTKDCEE